MNTTFTHRKHHAVLNKLLLSLLLIGFLTACQSSSQKEETDETPDSVVLKTPSAEQLNSDQSALLATIIGESQEGVIRGISFGDDIAKVKATETFEMFEETPDHLGYTSETPQLESIDVQYFINKEKKVNQVQVDVYLNSADATKQLWDAGTAYFSKQYDQPKTEGKILNWNKNSVKVTMEDVTKGKDFGLRFTFHPTNKNVLAAK